MYDISLPPHFNFSQTPTPIIPVKKCFTDSRHTRIYFKRDDLTGLELSGNKVRKLDFLLKDAVEQGAGRIITCGGMQSNHCRAAAYMARKLDLKTTLVLRESPSGSATGNYLLNALLDIDIRLIRPELYANVDAEMEKIASLYPESTYVIPEGGSNAIGAWGYVRAFLEIQQQIRENDLSIDTIMVSTGSGGTHAGLLIGKLLTGSDLDILSINVCDTAAEFVQKIDAIMHDFKQQFNENLHWQKDDIRIIDGFVGEGYGVISQREVQIIKRLAQTEGLLIDPVYGAKALLGLEHHIRNDSLKDRSILFIHTGGVFGLFPYGNQLMA
ncbi:MAG: pyridoxal-phosphate dependent enzyme [Caldithrix sp.]|nr:pyridoxal-phosphate dependent enzyme [Caldithrix sp.]